MILLSARRAANLHAAGVECSETGNEEGAIENYKKALALDPMRGDTLYNLGLIYKYRGDWASSFEFNARAREMQPGDEATLWNLAIAATALRDWKTARDVWRTLKIVTEDGEGPINQGMGQTPVRVNADAVADGVAEGLQDKPIEVVWSERLCPVRSRIVNIPTGATGFRYGDIVLHDGAPVGYRLNSYGKERAVFNVLKLFEPSRLSTYEAEIEAKSPESVQELERACDDAGIKIEDWTANMENLCKACSEGRPHEGHDQELEEQQPWSAQRRIGFAAMDRESLNGVLGVWAEKPGRIVVEMRCTLEAGVP
jgi:tetratricopeptide (TPR) repeat protein